MKNETPEKKYIFAALFPGIPAVVFLIACLLFKKLYSRFVISDTPVFFDLIIEDTALTGLNKAGELHLFYLLAGAGCVAVFLLTLLFCIRRRKKHPAFMADFQGSALSFEAVLPLCFLIPGLVYFLINGVCSLPLFFMAFYTILLNTFRISDPRTRVFPILSYYGILGLLTFCSLFFPAGSVLYSLPQNVLYLLTLFVTGVLFFGMHLEKKGHANILFILMVLLQLCIPLLLALFLHDRYQLPGSGEVARIPYAAGYYIFWGLLTLLSYGAILLPLLKRSNGSHRSDRAFEKVYDSSVAFVTPILIFLYQSYQACPMFAQPDQHHHGEQLIPWQQIMLLGQKAYDEYTPVSGLFPMVNGGIQHLLLGGTVSDYSPAICITTSVFALLTMALVCLHIGPKKARLFAILFSLPSYNRQYMVLPLLLLLYLPGLQKKTGLWLKLWLAGCFLGGLYYPLFGAAALVGTLPLACTMIRSFLNSRKENRKEKSGSILPSLAGWLLVLIPIAVALPLLYRMAIHTLTYSSQTVLADGISLAGQAPPESFLSKLPLSSSLKQSLYLLYRFFLPAVWLWIPAFCAGITLLFAGKTAEKTAGKTLPFLTTILVLAVSYSYTLVRADRGVLLARTAPILVAVAGMFLGIALVREKSLRFLLPLCLSLPFLCYGHVNDMKNPYLWTYPNGNDELVANDVSKLFPYYEVPDTFVSLQQIGTALSDPSLLGDGFMVADQADYLTAYDTVKRKVEKAGFSDITYACYDGQGFYYFLNTKACATGFYPVARSYEAQNEILDVIREKEPVIFPPDPQKSYYICRWLLSPDSAYCYSPKDRVFYPKKVADQIAKEEGDQMLPSEDYVKDLGSITDFETDPVHFGRIAQSFGDSAAYLLSDKQGICQCSLEIGAFCDSHKSMPGEQAELLYLPIEFDALPEELSENAEKISTLRITLAAGKESAAEESGAVVECDLTRDHSDLLVPLSMNPRFYLADYAWEDLTFSFLSEDGSILAKMGTDQLKSCLKNRPGQIPAAGFYTIHPE